MNLRRGRPFCIAFVGAAATGTGGFQNVNDLERAILEAAHAAGREVYRCALAALQEAWLAQHRQRFGAQRWRTLHWLPPFDPVKLSVQVVQEKSFGPLPHPIEGLAPAQKPPGCAPARGLGAGRWHAAERLWQLKRLLAEPLQWRCWWQFRPQFTLEPKPP